MKKFIDWLHDYLKQESGDSWSIEDTIEEVNIIHNQLLTEGHYGDCIKENITCRICEYQNWLDRYYDYVKKSSN
jgi:hypothetical protein